jgi:hypothetical protein
MRLPWGVLWIVERLFIVKGFSVKTTSGEDREAMPLKLERRRKN